MTDKHVPDELPLCSECVFHAEVEFDGKDYCVRCLHQAILRLQRHKNQDLYMKNNNKYKGKK
jgi:hypothetical protein